MAANMDALSLAQTFVKTVVRMFYDTEHVVVVDALVFHHCLSLSDLCLVLDYGKNQKGAQKLMGRLKEGGLISVHTRQEVREGAMKAISREYFYIDYRRAIDATKYRIHMLDERIKKDAAPTQEKKELSCDRCKAQWTMMEVLDNVDYHARKSGFLCNTCGNPLDMIDNEAEHIESDDTPAKFNKFFRPLLDQLRKIDSLNIPHIEGDAALKAQVPIPRDKDVNPAARHEAVPAATMRPATVKGMATTQEKIDVTIATNDEYSEAARVAEQQRQAKIAAQNMLPEWHTHSTVDKNASASQTIKSEVNGGSNPSIKQELVILDKQDKEADLDDVFARLEQEQREKAEKEQEESDEEEDDEDEDEFEDVVVSVATPNDTPDAKRVKLEGSVAPSPGATPAVSTGDGESDEDEFIDV